MKTRPRPGVRFVVAVLFAISFGSVTTAAGWGAPTAASGPSVTVTSSQLGFDWG